MNSVGKTRRRHQKRNWFNKLTSVENNQPTRAFLVQDAVSALATSHRILNYKTFYFLFKSFLVKLKQEKVYFVKMNSDFFEPFCRYVAPGNTRHRYTGMVVRDHRRVRHPGHHGPVSRRLASLACLADF